jgi:hypothetical protein
VSIEQRRRTLAIALGTAWLVALSAVVALALATRTDDVDLLDNATGPWIVALTVPWILLAAWRLRSVAIASITFLAAAAMSCDLAWATLHDRSSTAAVGLLAIVFYSGAIVLLGLTVQAVVRVARRSRLTHEGRAS